MLTALTVLSEPLPFGMHDLDYGPVLLTMAALLNPEDLLACVGSWGPEEKPPDNDPDPSPFADEPSDLDQDDPTDGSDISEED